MYQTRLRTLLGTLGYQLIWLVLILMTARYLMLSHFVEPGQLQSRADDVQRMWLTGLRFDLRIAGMALSPFALAGLVLAAGERSWHAVQIWAPRLLGVIAFLIGAVAIGNYYYYQTYHTHIDVFAFGLMEDDTQAVLGNMWQDYPIIQSLLLSLLLGWLPARWARRTLVQRERKPWPLTVFIVYLLAALTLLFVISRGSIGTFPLRRGNAQVSDLLALNKLTPNGFMAIDWAIKDREEDIAFNPVSHAEGETLLAEVGLDSLMARTPHNPWLAEHKPNVVMALMESFGSNMLAFDEPGKNDLLGSLRPHFKEDFVFKRFLSEDNGTAPSLAALFFHSPAQNISHSSAQHQTLSGTPFALYKQAGYKLIFISPGNMMWRNLVNYLPVQGVDEVYDQNALMKRYPQAAKEITAWGVPDDYAYRLAQTLLEEATQPLFISILTITNHPPYETPARYQPQPIATTAAVMTHAEDGSIEQTNILKTYQFATDALGRFVSAIKGSSLGDKTLIAASGDHQMRRLRAFYPREQVLDRAVPFYLYVPKPILAHSQWRFDPLRVGSHKDIFPTLYSFSLSDTPYQTLAGRNMLAPVDDPSRAFGYNVTLWIDDKGAYPMSGKPMFYPWRDDRQLTVSEQGEPVDKAQQQRQQALPDLLRWQLNSRVKGFLDPEPDGQSAQ
ncbi:LTA synthase family protein [Aeromonas rivuli]|uniref:LTA synthase family protein n=1 Tax=Aeromonas rivuli TaxID=648794 RepID=UPI001CC91357|nr:LTA synthase family protein [Aeromonas rivuli]UBO73960.1 LTA synthase family protein [Aeromonas rivuli]